MIKKWRILESKNIFSSPFIILKEERLERSDGKIVYPYYAIERPDVVYIAALTENDEVVLVNQYKNGIQEVIWELPAGFIDRNESPSDAAKRELLEETGYTASKFILLGQFSSGSGLARNKNYFFFAKNAIKTGEQNLDENEEIEVDTKPYEELLENVKKVKGMLPEVQSQLAVLLLEGRI